MRRYEWDPEKDALNRRKHGVSLPEAETALDDRLAVTTPDTTHSGGEARFRTVGCSVKKRLLVVITSEGKGLPRIISARRARSANAMTTNVADPDMLPEYDFSSGERGRYAAGPGDGLEIHIDGAIGYSLRLIPSNKILGRFVSTVEAWPVVDALLEAGRSPRTLVLDWHAADGRSGIVASGVVLAAFAEQGAGRQRRRGSAPRPRRVAES